MEAQLDRIEAALGTALVVMKERAELCRHLAAKDSAPALEAHLLQRMLADAESGRRESKGCSKRRGCPCPDEDPSAARRAPAFDRNRNAARLGSGRRCASDTASPSLGEMRSAQGNANPRPKVAGLACGPCTGNHAVAAVRPG